MDAQSISTPGGILIRNAIQTDEPVIYQFICALEETTFDRTVFQLIFTQHLDTPSIHCFVAEKAGEVVGFINCHVQALLHHSGKVGEIQELFVRPDARSGGIGQLLIAEVKALAVREHWINLEVTTNRKRVGTVQFYERAGFTLTHAKLVTVL